MSRENPIWIHGELVKLHIDIDETNSPSYTNPDVRQMLRYLSLMWRGDQTSVGKYMAHRRNPPSQMWRTFLESHPNSGEPYQ